MQQSYLYMRNESTNVKYPGSWIFIGYLYCPLIRRGLLLAFRPSILSTPSSTSPFILPDCFSSAYTSNYPYIRIPTHPSNHWPIHLSSIGPSNHLTICQSIYPAICHSLCPLLHPSTKSCDFSTFAVELYSFAPGKCWFFLEYFNSITYFSAYSHLGWLLVSRSSSSSPLSSSTPPPPSSPSSSSSVVHH